MKTSFFTKIKYRLYLSVVSKLQSKNVADDVWVKLRCFLLRGKLKKMGEGCNIQQGVRFRCPENLSLGSGSGIGINSYIYSDGEIEIGENVMIGPEVMIFTSNHDYKVKNMMKADNLIKNVTISNNSWVGARSIILPGAMIAEGCVIAAGSVVTGIKTEKHTIYGGVPAKKIKRRSERYER